MSLVSWWRRCQGAPAKPASRGAPAAAPPVPSFAALSSVLGLLFLLVACQPAQNPAIVAPTDSAAELPVTTVSAAELPAPTVMPPATLTPIPTITLMPAIASLDPPATSTVFPIVQEMAGSNGHPTLADLWAGSAEFALEKEYTGLPMGESDTIVMGNGEFWSFLHSSNQHHAGAVDQCGDPVPFPGCTVLYRSYDGGRRFTHQNPPVCLFECAQCPCDNDTDHIAQQQYPRVHFDGERYYLVYEFQGEVMLRRSDDGLTWYAPEQIAQTGIWKLWLRPCSAAETIGQHPFVPYDYECLAGGPPGIFVEGDQLYVFLATGQSPGGMGCYVGHKNGAGPDFEPCRNNPLFRGTREYGPTDVTGPAANAYFDFRTVSSATIQKIATGEGVRYYMLYEGVRGPGPGDGGDTQFGLGMARSLTSEIDGPWERFEGNPLLVDLPGNVGLGHSDLVVYQGQTLLYTSLDGVLRSRLILQWR